jgi:hypothetical protein
MRKSRMLWLRFLVPCVSCALIPVMASLAQEGEPAFDQVVGRPRGLGQLPPQGAWCEIINVTPRWVVTQNHSGQQYPIAVDDLGEFLVRWPSSLDALGNQSVVEVVGQELGPNVVQTEHVDIFEGADRSLVAPAYNSLLPNSAMATTIDPAFNRFMNAWDYTGGMNLLYGWAYPLGPGMQTGIPTRLHLVGNATNNNPLQLSLPGNHLATVVAAPEARLTVSQVTRGAVSYIRKGDYAFLMPQAITPRGLILSQFVLYKSVPYRQFDPAR